VATLVSSHACAEASSPLGCAGSERGLPPDDVAIRFHGVTVKYRTRTGQDVIAIRDFSLDVRQEEFLSLVGPSGCGKSTALKLAARLISPTFGAISIRSTTTAPSFRDVAVVFQRPNLLPWLNVLNNVLYPARVLRRLTAADHEHAHALLQLVRLEGASDRLPGELSGGMQQRVSLCRALILDPKILLMDEPFSALDALTREELQFELLRVHRMTRKTILFVTHSVDEATMLSDRVAIMSAHPGRLLDLFAIDLPERSDDARTTQTFVAYARRIRDGINRRGDPSPLSSGTADGVRA
jgi:NitT/TauT family transport system ATP-binding protein